MKLTAIQNTGKKLLNAMSKKSPEILLIVGGIGLVTTVVVSCVETFRKLPGAISEAKNEIESVHKKYDSTSEENTKEENNESGRMLAAVYLKNGLKIAKIYLPSVGIGLLSFSGLIASNVILRKRAVALAATCFTLSESFNEYRNRVVTKYGKDADLDLLTGAALEEVKETIVGEDGKKKTVKKITRTVSTDKNLGFSRYFDRETAIEAYENDHDYNMMFVKAQQEIANHQLVAYGYLNLNDVYALLGMKRSAAASNVGWVYDKNDPEYQEYIDFGITELFRTGEDGEPEPVIFLDFNAKSNILEIAKDKGLITE